MKNMLIHTDINFDKPKVIKYDKDDNITIGYPIGNSNAYYLPLYYDQKDGKKIVIVDDKGKEIYYKDLINKQPTNRGIIPLLLLPWPVIVKELNMDADKTSVVTSVFYKPEDIKLLRTIYQNINVKGSINDALKINLITGNNGTFILMIQVPAPNNVNYTIYAIIEFEKSIEISGADNRMRVIL